MQGSIPAQGMRKSVTSSSLRGFQVAALVLIVFSLITITGLYSAWRIERVQKNVESVNQFYFPALKQLNLIHGKWSTYLRSFDQAVSFRKWGDSTYEMNRLKLHLKRSVSSNFIELEKIRNLSRIQGDAVSLKNLDKWLEQFMTYVDNEPKQFAELIALIGSQRYLEAAPIYMALKQQHTRLSNDLDQMVDEFEAEMTLLQLSSQNEVSNSQTLVFGLLALALIVALVVLVQLRRWFLPVLEWTTVAKEIAKKGLSQHVALPKVTRFMPTELSVLTTEFTQMAKTVLEREKTIELQRDKLKDQNRKLMGLMEAEEKLKHARKLLLAGNMSSQIAHEVRNPLNSLILQLEMLEEESTTEQAQKRIAQMIAQVEKLDRLTGQYLELGTKQTENKAHFDLNHLVEDMILFYQNEFQAMGIALALQLEGQPLMVHADKDQIAQVFLNLLKNAKDALGDKASERRVKIETSLRFGKAKLSVVDNGPGVQKEVMDKIFDPFFTTKAHGHGLGLSLSKQICLDHNGDLLCTKQTSAAGACFEIILPEEKMGRSDAQSIDR